MRQQNQQQFQYVSTGNAYYGDEQEEQSSGGFWATIVEAFVDLFFDEVDDDRPVGITRLSHQTFTGSNSMYANALGDHSLPPKKAAPPATTGNIFADGLPAQPAARGQFVQSKNQFYKPASNMFAQDFRYDRLAGQKPKAKPADDLYY